MHSGAVPSGGKEGEQRVSHWLIPAVSDYYGLVPGACVYFC